MAGEDARTTIEMDGVSIGEVRTIDLGEDRPQAEIPKAWESFLQEGDDLDDPKAYYRRLEPVLRDYVASDKERAMLDELYFVPEKDFGTKYADADGDYTVISKASQWRALEVLMGRAWREKLRKEEEKKKLEAELKTEMTAVEAPDPAATITYLEGTDTAAEGGDASVEDPIKGALNDLAAHNGYSVMVADLRADAAAGGTEQALDVAQFADGLDQEAQKLLQRAEQTAYTAAEATGIKLETNQTEADSNVTEQRIKNARNLLEKLRAGGGGNWQPAGFNNQN